MHSRIFIPILGLALISGCASAPPADLATPTPTSTAASTVRSVFGDVEVAISDAQSAAPVDLKDPNWFSCTSDLVGFADVDAQAQVTITNAAGVVIGIGELGAGTPDTSNTGGTCKFPFVVEDVPLDGDFFGIQIGNEVRGTTQFTLREMQTGPHLYLG